MGTQRVSASVKANWIEEHSEVFLVSEPLSRPGPRSACCRMSLTACMAGPWVATQSHAAPSPAEPRWSSLDWGLTPFASSCVCVWWGWGWGRAGWNQVSCQGPLHPQPLCSVLSGQPQSLPLPRTARGAVSPWGLVWAVGPPTGCQTSHVRANGKPPPIRDSSGQGRWRALWLLHLEPEGRVGQCQKVLVDINACTVQDLSVCFRSHFYVIFFWKVVFSFIQQGYLETSAFVLL